MNETNQDTSSTIFRKDAVDKLNSPERLDEYLRVTRPSTWLLLGAIAALLIGACVWSVFGHMDTIVSTAAWVMEDETVCYVRADDVAKLQPGMEVKVSGEVMTVVSIAETPTRVNQTELGTYLLTVGGLQEGEWVYTAVLSGGSLPAGIYPAEIVVESIAPMSFILN